MLTLISHAGHGIAGGGEIALAAIMIAAMVVPLLVLGVIGRTFLRASKRDAEQRQPRP